MTGLRAHIDGLKITQGTVTQGTETTRWGDTESGNAILRKQVGKTVHIVANLNPIELIVVKSVLQQQRPVDEFAQRQRLIKKDGMMFQMSRREEGGVAQCQLQQMVRQRTSAPLRFPAVVARQSGIKQIAMALKRNAIEKERGMARVLCVDVDALLTQEGVDLKPQFPRKIDIIVTTFTMQRQRIASGQRAAFDHDGVYVEGLMDGLRKMLQRRFTTTVVVLNGFHAAEQTEQHLPGYSFAVSQRESGNSIVQQRGNCVTFGIRYQRTPLVGSEEKRWFLSMKKAIFQQCH